MHIPDGIIDAPVILVGGYAVTGGLTWFCLDRINRRERDPQSKIPKAALLAATFFVVNAINIPVPPSSLHLVLNGMLGVVLGYYAFPAILVALFFEAIIFQHGGITTLGLNGMIMGFPALIAFYLFRWRSRFKLKEPLRTKVFAFLAGAGGVMIAAGIFTLTVILTITSDLDAQAERQATYVALALYGIPAVIEGIFTMMLASFLDRVKPGLLEGTLKVGEP
ncbi:MAG: cobalt transporter CbiM [Chloroflexaceae bacterium]|nr:cobalt transporter CbiM [Chloroflexaceae bacterium]